MEVVAQIQTLVQEHAFFIGVGLLVLVAAVAVAWFWMSRGSGSSSEEGKVLVNQARMNEADMGEGAPMIPPSAMAGPPSSPVMVDPEEAEAQRAAMMAQAAEAE
jgi:hypothetical protein